MVFTSHAAPGGKASEDEERDGEENESAQLLNGKKSAALPCGYGHRRSSNLGVMTSSKCLVYVDPNECEDEAGNSESPETKGATSDERVSETEEKAQTPWRGEMDGAHLTHLNENICTDAASFRFVLLG